METLKFKTNIKCSGCVAAVTPILNQVPEISKWEVDTNAPEKVLTIESKGELPTQQVIESLKKAGYSAEKI